MESWMRPAEVWLCSNWLVSQCWCGPMLVVDEDFNAAWLFFQGPRLLLTTKCCACLCAGRG